jgi:hypothetical protein
VRQSCPARASEPRIGARGRGSAKLIVALLSLCLTDCVLLDPFPQPRASSDNKSGASLARSLRELLFGDRDAEVAQAFVNLCTSTLPSSPGSNEQRENLCEAFGYAERFRLAYYSAARAHSVARNSAALATVPLAAVGVFEGLRERSSSDRIARIGVEAIALYSLTAALTSSPRQKVYLSGAKAMVCVMFEARPLLVGTAHYQELSASIAAVLASIAAWKPADGSEVLVDSTNAVARANRVKNELAMAGLTLRNRVDLIAMQVASFLLETEPSPESIHSLFSSFGSLTTAFTRGVAASRTPGASQFRGGARPVVDPTAKLNAVLDAIGETSSIIDRIAECRPEAADSGFAVSPEDPAISVPDDTSFDFTITNKVGFPVARLEGSQTASVTLGPITVKGAGQFGVSIRAETPTGENGPLLVLVDGTGTRSKAIRVLVAGAVPAPARRAATSARSSLDPGESRLLTGSSIGLRSLQCYVGVAMDGKLGEKTRAAIAAKRTSTPDDTAEPGKVDTALIREIEAALSAGSKACAGL